MHFSESFRNDDLAQFVRMHETLLNHIRCILHMGQSIHAVDHIMNDRGFLVLGTKSYEFRIEDGNQMID